MRRFDLRWRIGLLALLVFGLTGFGERWLSDMRPVAPEERVARTIFVVSGRDDGSGTLREALFEAARAPDRVRILLRTGLIELETPLPPISNRAGVVIESGNRRSVIDGAKLDAPMILDVAAPNSIIQRIDLRSSQGTGILVRQANVLIRDVRIEDCDEAIRVDDDARSVDIEDSQFVRNGIGVAVAEAATQVLVRGNEFSESRRAAVWNVSSQRFATPTASRLRISQNRFDSDRIAIVVGNGSPALESNTITDARESAIYILGGEAEAVGNSIRGGWMGIVLDEVEGGRVEDNEIQGARGVALMARGGDDCLVRANRVHRNGYGIASIFSRASAPQRFVENVVLTSSMDGIYVVGGAPEIIENRSLESGGAGIRLVDFVSAGGATLPAAPRLLGNVIEGSRAGALVRSTYEAEESPAGGSG